MHLSTPRSISPNVDPFLGGEEFETSKLTQSIPNMEWTFGIGWVGFGEVHEMRALENKYRSNFNIQQITSLDSDAVIQLG